LLNRVLHWAGSILGLIGVIFVILKLRHHADQIDLQAIDNVAWLSMAALAVVYGSGNTMLARAWYLILNSLGVHPIWFWVLKTYGVSQLAKYIPGNVFQLASRQAMCQAAGLPAGAAAKSALYELAQIAIAGLMFSALMIPLLVSAWSIFSGILVFLLVFATVIYLTRHWFGTYIGNALVWETLFFFVSGMIFVVVVHIINPAIISIGIVPSLCGAYVIAWLAGFLTPGAPAGIGVRELVLTFLLRGIVPEADLLLAVVLVRGITILGDLGFFTFTSLLKSRVKI
jgi:uncharacterized membrane protein YbhN (UPF0104 family)